MAKGLALVEVSATVGEWQKERLATLGEQSLQLD
jgi:hypothetical protein